MTTPIENGRRIKEIKDLIAKIEASGEVRYGCLSTYPKKGRRYYKFNPRVEDIEKKPRSCTKQEAANFRASLARGQQIIKLRQELKLLGGD